MATIYRFVVEQKTTGGSSGRKSGEAQSNHKKKGTTAKKGRWVSIVGGEKGGVEHNRKMRAINPLINRATGGYWEKGMRVGRAGLGLIQRNTETGKLGISGPAIAIIISLIIQTVLKLQRKDIEGAKKLNAQNYKMLENGVGAIHGEYSISVNMWNGARTYNQNK